MADINLKLVKQTLQADFRAYGEGSTRFDTALQTAINMVIGEINIGADLATPISTISELDGTMGLDDVYLSVVINLAGLTMMALGQRPAKGKEVKYQIDETLKAEMIDSIRQNILNKAVAADTLDETSYVGLGALG